MHLLLLPLKTCWAKLRQSWNLKTNLIAWEQVLRAGNREPDKLRIFLSSQIYGSPIKKRLYEIDSRISEDQWIQGEVPTTIYAIRYESVCIMLLAGHKCNIYIYIFWTFHHLNMLIMISILKIVCPMMLKVMPPFAYRSYITYFRLITCISEDLHHVPKLCFTFW